MHVLVVVVFEASATKNQDDRTTMQVSAYGSFSEQLPAKKKPNKTSKKVTP
jgi:hypothetical protein